MNLVITKTVCMHDSMDVCMNAYIGGTNDKVHI